MLRAHRSTFKPSSDGCLIRYYNSAEPASVGLGSLTDANFNLSDDFFEITSDSDGHTFEVPANTSKIMVYLTSEGNIPYCFYAQSPCDNNGSFSCPDGSACCPGQTLGTCCNQSTGICSHNVPEDECVGCFKPGGPHDCSACGKDCCIDKCEEACEENMCWPENCTAFGGSLVDDCAQDCRLDDTYHICQSGNAGCAGGNCQCVEIQCDEVEAFQNRGVNVYVNDDTCGGGCIPRYACCSDGQCINLGICSDGTAPNLTHCNIYECDRCCGDGQFPRTTYESLKVTEGDILTTSQTTFLNKGKLTLTTATPISKATAGAYNALLASSLSSNIVPRNLGRETNENIANQFTVDYEVNTSPPPANFLSCDLCQGDTPPGDIRVTCPAPVSSLIILEYDVSSICSSIPLEIKFKKVPISAGTEIWYEENDYKYEIQLRTSATFQEEPSYIILQDYITRGHSKVIGPVSPTVSCDTCGWQWNCQESIEPVNGQYSTFTVENGYEANGPGIYNTKRTVVNLASGTYSVQTTIVAAGENLIAYDEDGIRIPVIQGGPSNNSTDDANWSVITNQLRWNPSRRKSEYLGNTYIAGESSGALQNNYAVNAIVIGDECATTTPGSSLFGVVMDDAGFTYYSNPSGLYRNQSYTEVLQQGVYQKITITEGTPSFSAQYVQDNNYPGIYNSIFRDSGTFSSNIFSTNLEGDNATISLFYGTEGGGDTMNNVFVDMRFAGVTLWKTYSSDGIGSTELATISSDRITTSDLSLSCPNRFRYGTSNGYSDLEIRVRTRPNWDNQYDAISTFNYFTVSDDLDGFNWLFDYSSVANYPSSIVSYEYNSSSNYIVTPESLITSDISNFAEYIAIYSVANTNVNPLGWYIFKSIGFEYGSPCEDVLNCPNSGKPIRVLYEFIESNVSGTFNKDTIPASNKYRLLTLKNYSEGDVVYWSNSYTNPSSI